MNCSHCGKPVPAGQLVLLNETPLHAAPCFGEALKKHRRLAPPDDFTLDIRALSAQAAYRLGQQSSELIFGRRPRAKKKASRG